jgi:hypothetical protein
MTMSKHYSKKYSFITNAFASVMIYLIKGLMYMPQSIQDFIYQLVSTSGLGYVSVLLIKMYRIHPALPFLPVLIIAVIIHLVIKNDQENNRFSKLNSIVPLPSTTPLKDDPSNPSSSTAKVQPVMSSNNNTSHMTRRQSVIAALTISDQLLNRTLNADTVKSKESNKSFMDCALDEEKSNFDDADNNIKNVSSDMDMSKRVNRLFDSLSYDFYNDGSDDSFPNPGDNNVSSVVGLESRDNLSESSSVEVSDSSESSDDILNDEIIGKYFTKMIHNVSQNTNV